MKAPSTAAAKDLFLALAVYVVLFPAVAIVTASVRAWMLISRTALTGGGGLTLLILLGYAGLVLPAFATALIHNLLDRLQVAFAPLLVTLSTVVASELVFHLATRGQPADLPNLDFYAAIAGLTCYLIVDRLRTLRSA